MNEINLLLRENEVQWIIQTVRVFDAKADIFLFGPGTKRPGSYLDVYIRSEEIDGPTRDLIKKQLNRMNVNIDMVCELKDRDTMAHLKIIGVSL